MHGHQDKKRNWKNDNGDDDDDDDDNDNMPMASPLYEIKLCTCTRKSGIPALPIIVAVRQTGRRT